MNISLRPAQSSHLLEMALRELHIEQDPRLNDTIEINEDDLEGEESFLERRSGIDERILAPRVSSFENSFIEQANTSIPSLDEMIIRQRGRKKQPAKISWSPIKSPFKTPTKKNSSTLHMSLLSPSPQKKLFNNNNSSTMVLRNSPRKRIFNETINDQDPTSSTPVSTPTKRLKFTDDKPMNAINPEVSLKTLLKGLSHDQLINIICGIGSKDKELEQNIRNNLPLPDIRPFEEELCTLRKNVCKSSPRRLSIQSKTDGTAFSRASTHLSSFKKAIMNHCKKLNDSQHYDALIDYILMAWIYVRGIPIWDEAHHNLIRKDCFKFLTISAKHGIKYGGVNLGADRIKNFHNKFKSMVNDFEELGRCKEALNSLAAKI